MKTRLNHPREALTYSLERLYDQEKNIQKNLPSLAGKVSSGALKKELTQYHKASHDKRLKLKRVFSYLLTGPFRPKSKTTRRVLEEANDLRRLSKGSDMEAALVGNAMRALILSRVATYELALETAGRLELEAVCDLLEEILSWERASVQSLKKIESNSLAARGKK